jgi:hypothetical protein
MIQPDAKCVVNGAKVNEAIMALNPLLAMSVGYIGGGKPPQVTYSDGEVKILLPLADSVDGFSLEELDIVDTDNAASSRYFMTSTSSVSTYGTTTASTSGTPTGKQSTSQPTSKDRNSLNGTPNNKNRDKLDTGGALLDSSGSGGVAPTGNVTGGGGALRDDGSRPANQGGGIAGGMADDGQTAEQSRANFLANKQRAADTTPAPSGIAGGMADDGQTAEQSRTNFLANQQRAADTTPAPLPGGMPLMSDTTPAPLPGGMPLMSDTTPPPTPGAPSSTSGGGGRTSSGRPMVSSGELAKGQWLPAKGGNVDLSSLQKLVESGRATPYQANYYKEAMDKSIPIKGGKIDLQQLKKMVDSGNASDYQANYYKEITANMSDAKRIE